MTAKVTIGMPVMNGEKYIAEAIESALSQSFNDFQLLISDNASTDSTGEICRHYAQLENRISYVRQEQNIGAFRNFDYVLQQAESPFFTWLASDDVLEIEYIEKVLATFEEKDALVLSSSDFGVIDHTGKRIEVQRLKSIRPSLPWDRRRLEFFQHPISNAYLCIYGIMRTAPAQKVFASIQSPGILSQSELPFLSRMAIEGEIASLADTLRQYRRHPDSIYFREQEVIKQNSRLRERLWRFQHSNRLRIAQFQVLLNSEMRTREKFFILANVGNIYATTLARWPLRVLKRTFRID